MRCGLKSNNLESKRPISVIYDSFHYYSSRNVSRCGRENDYTEDIVNTAGCVSAGGVGSTANVVVQLLQQHGPRLTKASLTSHQPRGMSDEWQWSNSRCLPDDSSWDETEA